MAKRNGGIIGPSNVPTGQYGGTASGVWRLRDAFNYIKAGLWPGFATYPVANSLRFNSASSDYLNRTPASNGNRRTFTISSWVKISKIQTTGLILNANSGSPWGLLEFSTGDGVGSAHSLQFSVTAGVSPGVYTSQIFRDPSAWYHIVCAVDTTQATASNRVKIYINGIQSTLISGNYPTLNQDTQFNSTIAHQIGNPTAYSNPSDFYLSEIYMIDGQALTPSSFGQTDSATGIWTPLPYTGTYGTNGFYLKFANSAALGTDSSGNGNNFTVNNLTSVDQSTDTPTNNFATLNPLNFTPSAITYTEGNLKTAYPASWNASISTIGVSAGKWYWEAKAVTAGNNIFYGIMTENATTNTATPYTQIGVLCGKTTDGDKYLDTTYTAAGFGTSANGDILGFALDLDSGTKNLTINLNGTLITGGSVNLTSNFNNVNIFAFFAGNSSSAAAGWELNFGSPPFTISSGNADANGFGNFEYAVPSGYYALCTKNLATYG
jgi:hypothetical protein